MTQLHTGPLQTGRLVLYPTEYLVMAYRIPSYSSGKALSPCTLLWYIQYQFPCSSCFRSGMPTSSLAAQLPSWPALQWRWRGALRSSCPSPTVPLTLLPYPTSSRTRSSGEEARSAETRPCHSPHSIGRMGVGTKGFSSSTGSRLLCIWCLHGVCVPCTVVKIQLNNVNLLN